MKIKLNDSEAELNEVIQAKWKQFVESSDIDNLRLPQETFSVLRVVFQLAYQEGQADTFTQIKEIYDQDTDYFLELFDDEDDEALYS